MAAISRDWVQFHQDRNRSTYHLMCRLSLLHSGNMCDIGMFRIVVWDTIGSYDRVLCIRWLLFSVRHWQRVSRQHTSRVLSRMAYLQRECMYVSMNITSASWTSLRRSSSSGSQMQRRSSRRGILSRNLPMLCCSSRADLSVKRERIRPTVQRELRRTIWSNLIPIAVL